MKLLLKTTILVVLFSYNFRLMANNYIFEEDSVSAAIRLFENEDYAAALPLFEKIVKDDPDNKMMNYYYGASLAENEIFNETTNTSLLKAVSGNTPDKVLYYVGLFFQKKELWNSALKYFNLYKGISTSENNVALEIDTRIAECNEKTIPTPVISIDTMVMEETIIDSDSPSSEIPQTVMLEELSEITVEEPEPQTEVTEEHVEVTVEEPEPQIEVIEKHGEVIEEETEPQTEVTNELTNVLVDEPQPIIEKKLEAKKVASRVIDFQLNSNIAYSRIEHFKSEESKNFYLQGEIFALKLDSILQKSDSLRSIYANASSMEERNLVAEKIMKAERSTMTLKSESDHYFQDARQLELDYWSKATSAEMDAFKKELLNLTETEIENNEDEQLVVDSIAEFDPSLFFAEKQGEIKASEEVQKDELIYRIQIGAYSRGLPAYMDRLYKKLSVIRKIENYTDDKGIVVYTTGRLTNFEDAVKMQRQVRREGIKDAFVVPYLNGKRISMKEAKELTK